MPTAMRPAASITRYAIIDKNKPDTLYGEGTFGTEDSAVETADNLNSLLSVENKVYRAVAHVFTEELVLVGEEDEYLTVPERQQVPIAIAAATGSTPVVTGSTPTDESSTDEPDEPGEGVKAETGTVDVVPEGEPLPEYLR